MRQRRHHMSKSQKVEALKTEIMTMVRAEEKRAGHLFSGGEGLSMFLTFIVKVPGFKRAATIRTYGNDVVEGELRRMCRQRLGPDFVAMEGRLD